MTVHLAWWAWLFLPAAILAAGLLRAAHSASHDTGMSAGIEALFIAVGAFAASAALAIGILIGHFA